MSNDAKSPSATLNMPETAFPMRGDLPKREPEFLRQWDERKLYETRITQNQATGKKFFIPDGPPYANGGIHHGHILNKILKDIVVKYHSMKGELTKFVPGFDCHGLPIERAAAQEIKGLDQQPISEIRKACRDYAMRWVKTQSDEFKRLGVFALWDAPYRTLDYPYEARTAQLFGEMVRAGLVYRGQKPVYWCTVDRTALAEAEIEYHPKQSSSIYVKFPVAAESRTALLEKFQVQPEAGSLSVVIWTTTPWTLPANLAVSANPNFAYVLCAPEQKPGELWLIAEGLREAVEKDAGAGALNVVGRKVEGKDLEWTKLQHPFIADRQVPVIVGTHVTLDAGTGLVHTAPGHGQEDYKIGATYKLGILSPVDDRGVFTEEAGKYAGLSYDKANPEIVNDLRALGMLVAEHTITHEFPHSWRSKKPVIFRTTPQWFASMDEWPGAPDSNKPSLRQAALAEIDKTQFIPPWGHDRIASMVEGRPDWCLSRQRSWGVPIVAFFCESCGEVLLDPDVIAHVAQEHFAKNGCDSWWSDPAASFLPAGTKCKKCGASEFRKETDILDVWFDSGVFWYAVAEEDPQLGFSADLYLEGSDQHRGWFQSSLLTAVGIRGAAPYKRLLTHGFVCDENGKKYSKSSKNFIAPKQLIEKNGAEVMRIWAAAEDFRNDMRFSPGILEKFIEAYKKIRNTYKHMLGCLSDPQLGAGVYFDPRKDKLETKDLWAIDRWMLDRLSQYLGAVGRAYEDCEFHRVFYETVNFFTSELSARYLDITRDRLYTYRTTEEARRSVQTVIYEVVTKTAAALAPIFTFTTEDVWQHLWREVFAPLGQPFGENELNIPGSVHLCEFPSADPAWSLSEEERAKFEKLFALKDLVNVALEGWRRQLQAQNAPKGSGNSMAAQVLLYAAPGSPEDQLLSGNLVDLEEFFIVSRVQQTAPNGDDSEWVRDERSSFAVKIAAASGEKCPRCWRYTEDVKERPGLVPSASDFPKAAAEGPVSFSLCDRCADELA